MKALPQALEIIFEVPKKRNIRKIARRKKKAFQLTKHIFFFFLLFGPFVLSRLLTFSFLVHFKQLKML
jgi:hypothetical protein